MVAATDSPAVNYDGNLQTFGGTSCANPNMAGIASLVWSVNPDLTGPQVRQILIDTAMDLGDVGRDNTYGHGLVNADAAVRRAVALARSPDLAALYSGSSISGLYAASATTPSTSSGSTTASSPSSSSLIVSPSIAVTDHSTAPAGRIESASDLFWPTASPNGNQTVHHRRFDADDSTLLIAALAASRTRRPAVDAEATESAPHSLASVPSIDAELYDEAFAQLDADEFLALEA
jgi:hypothetical protein